MSDTHRITDCFYFNLRGKYIVYFKGKLPKISGNLKQEQDWGAPYLVSRQGIENNDKCAKDIKKYWNYKLRA